jgi:hypothetical protein
MAFQIAPPPDKLNPYIGIQAPITREASVSFHSFTMRPVEKEKKEPRVQESSSVADSYKKRSNLRKTLGWYYYVPAFLRPRKRMSAVVASMDSEDVVLAGATKNRNKALLIDACAAGNWSTVCSLLDMASLSINEAGENGELPLCAAATKGQGAVILKIYDYCRPDLLKARAEDNMTPLMCAAQEGQVEAATALLKCGDLLPVMCAHDHITAVDENNMDARAHAVKKGSSGVVEAIDAAERRTLGRPAICRRNCGMKITYGEKAEHEKIHCPVVACRCSLCGKTVRRTYFDVHAGYECENRVRLPSPR